MRDTRGALWQPATRYGSGVRFHGFSGGTGTAEHMVTQIRTECVAAILVGFHGRNGVEFKLHDDGYQKVAGGQTLSVAQIGRVGIRHTDLCREIFVSHCHESQYVRCVTNRQRGPDVRHEFDQGQVSELARHVAGIARSLLKGFRIGADRWTRERALAAAVAFHGQRVNGVPTQSINETVETAQIFEQYIRNGELN